MREAARLAEALAEELEDDAIDASFYILWKRYAVTLDSAVRLAECDLSDPEILARLRVCTDTIGRPEGAPY